MPFTLGLGAAAFVAFERMFGPTAGTLFSLAFILTGLALLYGVGFALPSAAWFPDHRDVDKVVSRASPDAGFFRIGSALVVTASLPFAIGISADVAVVFFKATQRSGISGSADVGSLCMLLEPGWFTLPGAVRPQAPRLNGPLMGELKAPLGPTAIHLCIDAAAVRAGRTWPAPWTERVLPNVIHLASERLLVPCSRGSFRRAPPMTSRGCGGPII